MANIREVEASAFISKVAEKLKGIIKEPPEYIHYVKSGANKERVPADPDFWYIRSASLLRQVYLNGPIGIARLRVRYGSRKEHVIHRKHHVNAGGSIIQDSLKALEKADFIKVTKAGRQITQKGQSFVDKISNDLLNTA
ncbi:MAG: 40S ribosomal protein S19 [Candidatus Micrarchaeaceae archaeon]